MSSRTTSRPGLATFLAATRHKVPQEEIRFAVVLNGGVSLAVWMGGAVVEVDRLTRADAAGDSPYDLMLRLTSSAARADIITGTSAGGINGAALALSQVNRQARIDLLRDLWADHGRIEALLRPPFSGQPTSLLRGDEYFLPQLETALGLLAQHTDRSLTEAADAPIDLTITTTVLRGNQLVTVDSMGQQLPQSVHAGRFRWRRSVGGTALPPEQDPFSAHCIERTATELALAARSTASFPVAFEPSFVPVDAGQAPPDRPDMGARVAQWGTRRAGPDGEPVDRSRFVVDGGLLANTPTAPALKAIEDMHAAGPVRRVMLLVFPHAPEPAAMPADSADKPPTITGALGGMLGALTAQGSRTYVEELERHNLAAAGRRGARADILRDVEDAADLEALARRVYPQFLRVRRWRAARDLSAWRTGLVTVEQAGDPAVMPGNRDLPANWGFDRVREEAERAQETWFDRHGDLPYAMAEPPAVGQQGAGWAWGVTGARGIADSASDLLRRLVAVVGADEECEGVSLEAIEQARNDVFTRAAAIRACRGMTDDMWAQEDALTQLPPDSAYWTLRLVSYDHLMLGAVEEDERLRALRAVADGEEALGRIKTALAPTWQDPAGAGSAVRQHVEAILTAVRGVLPAVLDVSLHQRDPVLPCWAKVFPDSRQPHFDNEALLLRLLHLEVVCTVMGDEVAAGTTQPVELVQISAQTQNGFATYSDSGAKKLGGDMVARFGGFLKRSWRVNDWIWGRADAETMLSRLVLDPRRIWRTAQLSGYLDPLPDGDKARELAESTVAELCAKLPDAQAIRDLEQGAVAELATVFGRQPGAPLPSALPHLAAMFGWALHLETVPRELPALAAALSADEVEGANRRSKGQVFLAEHRHLLDRLEAAGPAEPLPVDDRVRALSAFDRAGIGSEQLREEATSDMLIRTAATAAATGTTVLDSAARSGLGAIRPVTRAVRGAMLLPYWTVWALSTKSTLARSLATLGLALGGVLVGLALLGALPESFSGPAAAIGAAFILTAFAYGALRTGSLLHSVVLLTPLIPLVVFALDGSAGFDDAERTRGATVLVVVALLAVALMLLGSIGVAGSSVWPTLERAADRLRVPMGWHAVVRRLLAVAGSAGLVILACLAILGLLRAVRWSVEPDLLEFVQDNAWIFWGTVLVVVVVAAYAATRLSGWLRVVQTEQGVPTGFGSLAHPDGVAAGWAVVYGIAYAAVAFTVSLPQLPLDDQLWGRTAFATSAAGAVLLLLVVPAWLVLRALAVFVRGELRPTGSRHDPPDDYAADLVARKVAYYRFVRVADERATFSGAGWKLLRRVHPVDPATLDGDEVAFARLAARGGAGGSDERNLVAVAFMEAYLQLDDITPPKVDAFFAQAGWKRARIPDDSLDQTITRTRWLEHAGPTLRVTDAGWEAFARLDEPATAGQAAP
jgi:patatin-related protein